MKKIDEQTKITLTVGQLRRLVRESYSDHPEDSWSIVATKGKPKGKFLSYDYSFSSWGFDNNVRNLLRFKSKDAAENYLTNRLGSRFCKDFGAKVVPAPLIVRFSASGHSPVRKLYATDLDVRKDAEGIAADHDGKVEDWGDIVVTVDGEEIARWEIL